MLRFAVYVLSALIVLQTTFSQEDGNPKDCSNDMGPLPGEGCPEEVRNPLYKKLNETNSNLKYNCTLEGIALVTATFKNESAYRGLYNETASKQLQYSEKNTVGRNYNINKPWGNLNISNFINNATKTWNLTSDSIKDKTEVGCYFDVDYNFTLVCAFA